MKRVALVVNSFLVASVIVGCVLMAINLYGLNRDIRPEGLTPEVLRFGEQDLTLSPIELNQAIVRRTEESDEAYARRLTLALANGIAHVEWLMYDPDTFHQRVPVWENFILYLMGVVTSIPEYERYHFSDPYRSLARGIGICGDASMTLSGLLDEQGIPNTIITVPGHVMVEAQLPDKTLLLDADFGVVLEHGAAYYQRQPEALALAYQAQLGRVNDGELMIANELKNVGYQVWNGTSHFITKKYYFEKFAYVAKWLFPVLMVLIPLWWMRRRTQPK